MKKRYLQKWQIYFVLLLQNVPLIIPREKSIDIRSGSKIVALTLAAAMVMANTVPYYSDTSKLHSRLR